MKIYRLFLRISTKIKEIGPVLCFKIRQMALKPSQTFSAGWWNRESFLELNG